MNTCNKLHILVFIVFLFGACRNDIDKVMNLPNGTRVPIRSAKDVELFYSDSAHVRICLRSPITEEYAGKDAYSEMPKGVDVSFYDLHLKESSHLSANYAIRYLQEGRMEAKNKVVIVNEKGETLQTEHLIWDERKHRIHTDDFVKITTKDQVIFGDGLESNEDFTRYKIKNIKGTIKQSFN